jgi:hypothetical protein
VLDLVCVALAAETAPTQWTIGIEQIIKARRFHPSASAARSTRCKETIPHVTEALEAGLELQRLECKIDCCNLGERAQLAVFAYEYVAAWSQVWPDCL